MTRGGINTILFVGKERQSLQRDAEPQSLFEACDFSDDAEANGIDPDLIENNPRMFTWFPDPDGAQSGQDEM